MFLGTLHQRTDDMLLSLHAAEEVLLRLRVGFVVEDRWMAGMGDKVCHIRPIRHFAGMRCSGVEYDECRAGADLVDDAVRDLADQPVRNRHENDVRSCKCLVLVDAIDADSRLETLTPLFGNFDVVNLEA